MDVRPEVPARVHRRAAGARVHVHTIAAVLLVACTVLLNLHQVAEAVNSDLLYPVSMARDLAGGRLRLRGWVLPPATYAFPDVTLMTLLWTVRRSTDAAYLAYAPLAATWFGLLHWRIVAIAGRTLDAVRRRWAWAAGMTLLAASSLVDRGLFPLMPMHFAAVFHGGAELCALSVVVLWACRLRDPGTLRLAAAATLLALGTFGDPLVIVQGLAPLLVATVLVRRRHGRDAVHLRWPVATTAGVMLGFAAYVLVPRLGFSTPGNGMEGITRSISRFTADLAQPLIGYPLWVAATLVAVTSLWVLRTPRGGRVALSAGTVAGAPREPAARALAYALTAMALGTTAATALTAYANTEHYRRMLPLFTLPLLLAPLLALLAAQRRRAPAPPHAAPLATAITVCVLLAGWSGIASARAGRGIVTTSLGRTGQLRCLDRLHARHRIGSGVGNYWTARYVTELSTTGAVVAPVRDDGHLYRVIVNPDIVLAPASVVGGIAHEPLDYVAVSRLDRDAIRAAYGTPDEEIDCEGLVLWRYAKARLAPIAAQLRDDARDLPGVRSTVGR